MRVSTCRSITERTGGIQEKTGDSRCVITYIKLIRLLVEYSTCFILLIFQN
jgi:hypothetical protein